MKQALGIILSGFFAALFVFYSANAWADSNDNRILWQIEYDSSLTAAQQGEVQNTMLKTLARAKERHFAGDSIIRQKIKKEGLNLPECFTSGSVCPHDKSMLLDVHNVDALANARFSYKNGEWQVEISLYRGVNAAPTQITRGAPKLDTLIQNVTASLFDMESVIEITSLTPDVDVYINNKYSGHPPLSIKISEGEQNVIFKKAGYVSETWNFSAEKGKVHSKQVELEPEKVQLTVLVTDSAADVFIDEQLWGKANESHDILPGDHKILVKSEASRDFAMDYKVYPGNPQTVHVAPLAKSTDPYEVRKRGILKYPFSVEAGFHYAHHTTTIYGEVEQSSNFFGATLAANYMRKYWGIGIFRLDLTGSDNAGSFIGFYPLEFKGHYHFWVMQAEATFGLGVAYKKLKTDGLYIETVKDYIAGNESRTNFSINFSLALKMFFSEESYGFISYDMQKDFKKSGDDIDFSLRHGLTLGFGYQLPILMRDKVDTSEETFKALDDESSSEQASQTIEGESNE